MRVWPERRWPLPGHDPLARGTPHLFVLARREPHARIAAGELGFFEELDRLAARHGTPAGLLRARPGRLDRLNRSPHLIVATGTRPVQGPFVFNASPGYLWGWWYFDEMGVREKSSIRLRRFHPETVDGREARRFQRQLRREAVGRRGTKYAQPARGAGAVPEGAIAVFAQEFDALVPPILFMELDALVEAVLRHRGGRPVYVKPHPLQTPAARARLLSRHAPERGVHVGDANLFDILEAASVTVSQCSAASFEGFLFDKPAILAGRTDFHQNAITVRSPGELADALAAATERDFAHARFLHWFLREHHLAPQEPGFAAALEARIVESGFWHEARVAP